MWILEIHLHVPLIYCIQDDTLLKSGNIYGLNKFMISVHYSGLDYSSPWHNDFLDAVEAMQCNLHVTHPSMQIVLGMCQTSLGQLLLVDLKGQRAQGPVECEHLKNNVILECEKMEERWVTFLKIC